MNLVKENKGHYGWHRLVSVILLFVFSFSLFFFFFHVFSVGDHPRFQPWLGCLTICILCILIENSRLDVIAYDNKILK